MNPGDAAFPVSQKAYDAALAAGLAIAAPPFWELIDEALIAAIDAAGDAACADAEAKDVRAAVDRPRIWHGAREAAFVARVADAGLARLRPEALLIAAEPHEPEAQGARAAAQAAHVPLRLLSAPARVSPYVPPPAPPEALALEPRMDGPWRLVIGTGIADLPERLRACARAAARTVLAADAAQSGDLPAIYALCARLGNVRVLPLFAADAPGYDEHADNAAYADFVRAALSPLFAQAPERCVISDLRRVETLVALDLARAHATPVEMRAHSGWPLAAPYRFDDSERAGAEAVAWTRSAALADGANRVEAPRWLRPDLARRVARALLRLGRAGGGTLTMGAVVSTGELYAAPDAPIAPVLRDAAALAACAQAAGAQLVLRLRRLEDRETVWRAALPQQVAFERQGERSFTAFARACDLLVEIGCESSAFLEAAANAAPYVRIGAPPSARRRIDRPAALVPRLDPDRLDDALAELLRSPRARLALGLRQHRAVLDETRPTAR